MLCSGGEALFLALVLFGLMFADPQDAATDVATLCWLLTSEVGRRGQYTGRRGQYIERRGAEARVQGQGINQTQTHLIVGGVGPSYSRRLRAQFIFKIT